MRITVHTPHIRVEEWDCPTLKPTDTDAEALAMVAGADPEHRLHLLAEFDMPNGRPYVYSRGEDDLEVVSRRLAAARDAEQHALEDAKLVALRKLEEGAASEREVASALGVDRSQVRAWRGKGRTSMSHEAPGVVAARAQRAAGIR